GPCFDVYRDLHRAAFGEARSFETFAVMREILAAGRGFVLIATSGAPEARLLWPSNDTMTPVGAALFFAYKWKAYYASAPRRPGSGGLPVGHFLVWHAMTMLAQLGYTALSLGP